MTVDRTAPTLAITSSSASTLKIGQTATITFTFSEDPGSSFIWNGTSGDIVVSGGTLSAISGTGLTRFATFTPNANTNNGTASITVTGGAYTDAAGNAGGAGASPSLTFDTSAPGTSTPDLVTSSDTGTWTTDNVTSDTTPTFTGTAEANATVTLYSGGTIVLGTATADGSGNWSITSSALAEGQHHISTKVTDAAGNTGSASTVVSVTIDTTAPAAPNAPDLSTDTGASGSDNITSGASLTFTGSAQPGAMVTLYGSDGVTALGSALASGGAYSITTSSLGSGTHNLTVRQADSAGNLSAASSALAVTVDLVAPAAPSTPDMRAADDSGTSNTDNITSTLTPTFTGTAEAGSTVSLFDSDGTTVLGTATAAGDGTWSITTSAMSEGSHTLTAKAVDIAGNTSAASGGVTVVIDTTAPAAPGTPDLDAASDTGASNSDNITGDTTPTFSGTAENGATVTLYEGATVLGTATATGGAWSITTPALGEGSHAITATVRDAAGNVSAASSAVTVQIDTSAPTTTVASAAFSADTGGSTSDFITNTAAQTISGTLSANLAAGETVQVSLDNGATWATATATTGANTWSYNATLAGSNTLKVRVRDAVDNAGVEYTQAYVLDTAAPTLAITSDKSSLKIGETATITFTFSEDPGASFAAGDITVAGGTLGALSGAGLTRTATFTPNTGTNGGTASITVAGGAYSDTAGNAGGAGTTPALAFDTLAPVAPSAPDLAAASDVGFSNTDNLTSASTLTFTGTAEAGSTVTLYGTDGTTVLGTGVATGGNWSIAVAGMAAGAHTVTARAVDAAGNAGPASGALAVTIDRTAPTLAITSDKAALRIGETATITFTFSEDPGASFTGADVTVAGGTLGALSGTGLTRTATFTPAAATNGGTASITVAGGAYSDAAGNIAGAAGTPALSFDTLAPTASSTPDLAAASDTGSSPTDNITADATPTFTGTAEANATVTLYGTDGTTVLGTAVADGAGNWSITSSVLAAGTHTVSTRVTDAAGNTGPASAGLAITVDLAAPATTIATAAFSADTGSSASDLVTATAAQTISGTLSANLAAGEIVQVSLDNGATWATATSAVGANTWSYNGTLAASNTLRVRVMDAVDNAGVEHVQTYVLDTAAPTVAITSDKAALKIGETATLTFTFSEDPGASFTAADITVSGGTLGALSGTGTTRTATFTPDAGTNGGTASITVAGGSYSDLAGNAGGAGATPALAFDTSAPAATSAPPPRGSEAGRPPFRAERRAPRRSPARSGRP